MLCAGVGAARRDFLCEGGEPVWHPVIYGARRRGANGSCSPYGFGEFFTEGSEAESAERAMGIRFMEKRLLEGLSGRQWLPPVAGVGDSGLVGQRV